MTADKWYQREAPDYLSYISSAILAAIDSQEDVFNQYEPYHGETSEIEHHSRDGFISRNDGGWELQAFGKLKYLEDSGVISALPEKAREVAQGLLDGGYRGISDTMKEDHPLAFQTVPEDQHIGWNEAEKVGLESQYEEIESSWYEDDTVMFTIGAFYRDAEYNSKLGKHECYVWCAINFEAPYHRRDTRWEWYSDAEFTFTNQGELQRELTESLRILTRDI